MRYGENAYYSRKTKFSCTTLIASDCLDEETVSARLVNGNLAILKLSEHPFYWFMES